MLYSSSNVLTDGGVLTSTLEGEDDGWQPWPVRGSLYLAMREAAEGHLLSGAGDWDWVVEHGANGRRRVFTAGEALEHAKRCACSKDCTSHHTTLVLVPVEVIHSTLVYYISRSHPYL